MDTTIQWDIQRINGGCIAYHVIFCMYLDRFYRVTNLKQGYLGLESSLQWRCGEESHVERGMNNQRIYGYIVFRQTHLAE